MTHMYTHNQGGNCVWILQVPRSWVMALTWMSHGTHMHSWWHTCAHAYRVGIVGAFYLCLAHVCICAITHSNVHRDSLVCVPWLVHVCTVFAFYLCLTNKSWHTYGRVMSHIWSSHSTYTYWVGTVLEFYRCLSHVSHGTHTIESRCTFEWVMAHIYIQGRYCVCMHLMSLSLQ